MNNTDIDRNKRIAKLGFILFVVTVILIVILIRVLILQIAYHDRELKKQQERIVQERTYEAKRGNIYSVDYDTGEYLMLATDLPIYDLYIDLGKQKNKSTGQSEWVIHDTVFNKQLKPMCDSLAAAFAYKKDAKTSKQYQDYFKTKRVQKNNRGVPVVRDISYEELQRIKTFPIIGSAKKKKNKATGDTITTYRLSHRVHIVEKGKRTYPYYPLARRTIGIKLKGCDTCYNGIDGGFDKYLRGEKGSRLERKINPGVWVPYDKDEKITARNGLDVVTSIDVSLQELAENSLMNCLQTNQAESGCVILMEVETGFVRAIASFSEIEGEYYENNNIAISSSFEPGSTFKTVTAMMMLDKGLVSLSDSVPTGVKHFPGSAKPVEDVGKVNRGNVTFERALEISSNVGISQLVYDHYGSAAKRKMFKEDLMQYFRYEKLNLDIDVHEPKPIIRSSENPTDLLRMSFGYVTQMTPLQMLTFYNAIANNGKMVKPQFVTELMRDGIVEKRFEPIVIVDSICKSTTREDIHKVLKGVVNNGTGRRLSGTSYGIAGKSGTSEMGYDTKEKMIQHRASFVGYFPADEPKYSCIVVISKPKGARTHGGDLAAPVFRDLSDRVVGTRINLSRVGESAEKKIPIMKYGNRDSYVAFCNALGYNVSAPASKWLKVKEVDSTLVFTPYFPQKDVVPNVIGLTIRDAIYMLENIGMRVRFNGKGKVVKQSIAPGSAISDEVIVLELAVPETKIQ
ncbi:MAG: transpeptidase family protein [Bacteroidales bacterium]|nr:transpeptidase family protein [Bacteroidales bacterium]